MKKPNTNVGKGIDNEIFTLEENCGVMAFQ